MDPQPVEAKRQSAGVAERQLPVVVAVVAVKQPRVEVAEAKQQPAGVVEATRPVEAEVKC
jgi:hypothetical protein